MFKKKVKKIIKVNKITNYVQLEDNMKTVKYYSSTRKKIKCPDYKIVKETTFGVDSFRFGIIGGVSHYFLTHFHSDHYIGLKKSFNKPIYLSEITGKLVQQFLHVNVKYLNIIEINKPFVINDIEIIALDANHCPGALMFFFKLPNGKNILHTGDFRACQEMESSPIFWNNHVDLIYLDTTYLTSKNSFISQWESVKIAMENVKDYINNNIGLRILIVCGSYLIGKEKVWLNIAEYFNFKVWAEPNRLKALLCLNDVLIVSKLEAAPEKAHMHILPMQNINYKFLSTYILQFEQHFDNIIAIKPSGWEKKSKPINIRNISIIGIEYSEHSSYDELKRFVNFLQPTKIISTVPNGTNILETPIINENWINIFKNKKKNYQTSITNYMKVKNCDRK